MSSGGEYIPVIPRATPHQINQIPLSVGSPAPPQAAPAASPHPLPGTAAPSLGAGAGAAHGERPLPARPCASQVRLELRARKSQRGESERFPVKNKTKQNNPNNTANLGT